MEIPNNYLDKFRVFIPETLFPPVWKNLEVGRCPICGSLLRTSRNKKLMRCVAKKCVGFKITPKTFYKLVPKEKK